jgi:transposase
MKGPAMNHNITELFCFVDDFCKAFDVETAKYRLSQKSRKPTRIPRLTNSEIITILLMFQTSYMKNFKRFYLRCMEKHRSEFPGMPSYERFLTLKPRVVQILTALFLCLRKNNSDTAFADSTPLKVCNNKRIFNHKVFKGTANRGKSTVGWFFGFKLHIVIDEKGEIINAVLTPGNVDDRKPLEDLLSFFQGVIFGDKGYISKELFAKLYEKGIKLVTGLKKGMQNILMPLKEKILLRKRSVVETVFGYMKNTLMLEHSRHRSPKNFLVHVLSTIVTYQLTKKKPSISPISPLITMH